MTNASAESANFPELVIGLIGPLGVDLDHVAECLQTDLRAVGYSSKLVGLSAILGTIGGLNVELKTEPEDERLRTHMKAGTELRSTTGRGGILAHLGLLQIQAHRKLRSGNAQTAIPKQAFVVRQLKHRDEIHDLRDIYGDGFLTLSIYAPRAERERAAVQRLRTKISGATEDWVKETALDLIKTDEAEEGKPLGQRVSDAFALGDYFIDATNRASTKKDIRRFIEILFQNNFQTPTRDEFGMYQASAVAKRSSDLSRQVGAALATEEGEVLALGCNDIPKAGGGLYWQGDEPDGRDFARIKQDPAHLAAREILADTLKRLHEQELLSKNVHSEKIGELCSELLRGPLKDSPQANLLEFGRALHAEMAVITDAAKRGVSTAGTTLFCTTFPCHLCARLIIASGILKVVFIEPYPKSKTKDMYGDSVAMDRFDIEKVSFLPFVGVAPRQYGRFFEMTSPRQDKDTGEALFWTADGAAPNVTRHQVAYLQTELDVTDRITGILEEAGLWILTDTDKPENTDDRPQEDDGKRT